MTINCVKQEKHTLKVYGAKKEMIYLNSTSKVNVTVGSAPFK